jgi:hypothetical protein
LTNNQHQATELVQLEYCIEPSRLDFDDETRVRLHCVSDFFVCLFVPLYYAWELFQMGAFFIGLGLDSKM